MLAFLRRKSLKAGKDYGFRRGISRGLRRILLVRSLMKIHTELAPRQRTL